MYLATSILCLTDPVFPNAKKDLAPLITGAGNEAIAIKGIPLYTSPVY
jgi:hypothetical protein